MQHAIRHAIASAFLASALAHVATAQGSVTHQFLGNVAGEVLGWSVAHAGDVDADGIGDWIVGVPGATVAGNPNAGRAEVRSGASGALLHVFTGTNPGAQCGHSVAGGGDVDGDGRPDLVVGQPYADVTAASFAGRVDVYSGATGALLRTLEASSIQEEFGYAVALAGDLDGDARADVIVGAPRADSLANNNGQAKVYSGASGALLYVLHGGSSFDLYGTSVASAGFVDGDAVPDVIVGAPQPGFGKFVPVGPGYATVHSGATGALLHSFVGAPFSRAGSSVDGAGDVDMDGRDDLVVGAPAHNGYFGRATVHSGATGALLHVIDGTAIGSTGHAVSGAGDVDMDGRADVLVATPSSLENEQQGAGRITVHSGLDGSALLVLKGLAAGDSLGYGLDGGVDADNDGFLDLIAGEPFADPSGASAAGRAKVFSTGGCAGPSVYCPATINSTFGPALIGFLGPTSIAANAFHLTATSLPPQTFGIFYYGTSAMQVPFGDGWRCVGGNTFRLPPTSTGAGVVDQALDFTAPPDPTGQIHPFSTWRFQYWYRDVAAGGAGFNLTNALLATFCP